MVFTEVQEIPINLIKRVMTTYYLKKDLTTAMSKYCLFTNLYLEGNATYGKKYTLVKPFTKVGMFRTSSARTEFIRALLDTNTYLKKCNFCSATFYNLLGHKLIWCPNLIAERKTLEHKLTFYGFTADFPQQTLWLNWTVDAHTLWNKNLLLALTDFLEIDNC